MKTKIFISYSHKDDSHRKALETHLSSLKRNGYVSTWTDRKIPIGDDWKKEIDKNIESSNIIIFLISADFIASNYCFEEEARLALEKHEKGEAILIPVVVRPCDWQDLAFGKLQALPEEGRPISIWANADEGWLNVIMALKEKINSIPEPPTIYKHQNNIWDLKIRKDFLNWLNDTEIRLLHRHTDSVLLEDIFVYPDLKKLISDIDKLANTFDSSDINLMSTWNILFGDEQSGKTSLAKQYYLLMLQNGMSPVFLNGNEINSSDITGVTKRAILDQYSDMDVDSFFSIVDKAIIIDDYSNNRLNRKYQNLFLNNLKNQFKCIVLFASDSFEYVATDINELDGFHHYEILRFGNLKRSELIQKWVKIGVEEEIRDDELYANLDALKLHVDSFVKKNIVPSKPLYLLTILQTFETFSPLSIELTSYGHCYQYLIYRALERAKIKHSDLDTYLNVLSEFAGLLLNEQSNGLDENDLAKFFLQYQLKYLKIDNEKILKDLLDVGILQFKDNRFSFKYRYIYYFYAAKFLSDNLSKSDLNRDKIQLLISNLHQEHSANIIIFLTHHTKDPWILDEIQLCMMELFQEHEEAKLETKDLDFMKEFLEEISQIVIDQRDIEQERRNDDIRKDEASQIEEDFDKKVSSLEPTDLLAKINRTFKSIELIGQIIRNRYGSLDRQTLLDLVGQAYSVGLRFLQFFLVLSDSAKEEVTKNIAHTLKENPSIENSKLEKEAKKIFLFITYAAIYGVLRKIAFSVGSKETEEIYQELENQNGSPSIKLINQAIELQFLKKIDDKHIKALAEEFKNNFVCERILKEIVMQHIYMHPIEFKEKQRISEILKIPVAGQRLIEMQKRFNM